MIKDNSGALFKKDKKEKDTDADYNGSVIIGGIEYWINGWKNTAKNGSSYLGLRFKPKMAKEQKDNIHIKSAPIDDMEIPF